MWGVQGQYGQGVPFRVCQSQIVRTAERREAHSGMARHGRGSNASSQPRLYCMGWRGGARKCRGRAPSLLFLGPVPFLYSASHYWSILMSVSQHDASVVASACLRK